MRFWKSRSAPERALESIKKTVRERPRATTATAVGIVAAAAASVAAMRLANGNGHGTDLRVAADDEAGWILSRDGIERPLDRFERKREAIEAGQELAQRRKPSSLTVHRSDGKVARTYVYEVS